VDSIYTLPRTAWLKLTDGRYTSNADRKFKWVSVTILHWCTDADSEPSAIYVDEKTGEVAAAHCYMFNFNSVPPNPNPHL
jgi:hypothetical protein